jgi:hypothetical protein
MGYLLRLAYRAGTSPAEIATRTGLHIRNRVGMSVALLHHLDAYETAVFSRATRLAPREVKGLLLGGLAPRYGPLDEALTRSKNASAVIIGGNTWVFFRSTRYCPECLAGDGSEIQCLLGGAWRRLWRIPAVFACLRHGCLLESHCPGCRERAQTSPQERLISRPGDRGLHPLQCRTSLKSSISTATIPCSTRYDMAASTHASLRPPTLAAILQLQGRLSWLLEASGSATTSTFGWQVPIGLYFMDLWALAALIYHTWPACRHLAATPELAQTMDDEADQRHRAYENRRRGKHHHSQGLTAAPVGSQASAAVLGIAEQFLAIGDESTAFEALEPLITRSIEKYPTLSYQLRSTRRASVPFREVLRLDRRAWAHYNEPSRAARILAHPAMIRATEAATMPSRNDLV